jgi:hypothetical protein
MRVACDGGLMRVACDGGLMRWPVTVVCGGGLPGL